MYARVNIYSSHTTVIPPCTTKYSTERSAIHSCGVKQPGAQRRTTRCLERLVLAIDQLDPPRVASAYSSSAYASGRGEKSLRCCTIAQNAAQAGRTQM